MDVHSSLGSNTKLSERALKGPSFIRLSMSSPFDLSCQSCFFLSFLPNASKAPLPAAEPLTVVEALGLNGLGGVIGFGPGLWLEAQSLLLP